MSKKKKEAGNEGSDKETHGNKSEEQEEQKMTFCNVVISYSRDCS
jgi:hypothetical protein